MFRILATVAGVFAAAYPVAAADPAKRPNVVWIVVDDMSANFSCYGEKLIQTPHVDRLAERGHALQQGVRHRPGVLAVPVGAHHRLYQTTIGAHHHRSGRGRAEDPPARRRRAGPGAVPAGRLLHVHRRARTAKGERARQDGLQLRVGPRRCTTATTGPAASPASRSSCRCNSTAASTAGSGPNKNWQDRVRKELGSTTDPDDVTLPPYYPRDPVLLQDWAAYLDCCRFTDKQVGDVLARLEKEKLLDETVVFFMTDHGISHARGKQFLYDEGTHVPLVVRGPGVDEGRRRATT